MVNMASGIARGCVLSPMAAAAATAATTSRKRGDLSHAGLVNIRSHKGSHSDTGYSCPLTAVKSRKPADQCHMTISRAQM